MNTPAKILYAVILCVILYSFIEPYTLRVSEFTVRDPQIPYGFDGKTIAFISDLHCGSFVSEDRLADIVSQVNSLNPDMILLGGDYTTRGSHNIQPCISELNALKAPLGVYGVLGNHDNWAGKQQTVRSLEEAGVTLLDNHAVWVESGDYKIRVGGVGDEWTDRQDLSKTLITTTPEDYVILLTHNPQYADKQESHQANLILSGHTHGGQILPVRLMAPYMPSRLRQTRVSGFYDEGSRKIIVTNGIGMVFTPNRLMAPPEIVRITLRKA
ncbi:MAG: metallophosphoesterase [Candidatus Altiarchaeota archaeon]